MKWLLCFTQLFICWKWGRKNGLFTNLIVISSSSSTQYTLKLGSVYSYSYQFYVYMCSVLARMKWQPGGIFTLRTNMFGALKHYFLLSQVHCTLDKAYIGMQILHESNATLISSQIILSNYSTYLDTYVGNFGQVSLLLICLLIISIELFIETRVFYTSELSKS